MDKEALITGAGRGIGRAISARFAREGADLFLCATRLETLEETAKQAAQFGRKTELHTVDVADRSAVEKMVRKAVDLFGKIDILVNNAGVYKPARFVDYEPEELQNILAFIATLDDDQVAARGDEKNKAEDDE